MVWLESIYFLKNCLNFYEFSTNFRFFSFFACFFFYTYWTSIQSYHQTLLPSAKAARDAAKTLLDDVEKDVNRIESELETKEALSDNYKKKMDALDVQITPLKKVRDNSDKEIARIVEGNSLTIPSL